MTNDNKLAGSLDSQDHSESYFRFPESTRREIDQIVGDVMSRIHDVADHFLVKKFLLPGVVNVMRSFSDRIDAARFGEMEVSVLLIEIWKMVGRELKLHKRTDYQRAIKVDGPDPER